MILSSLSPSTSSMLLSSRKCTFVASQSIGKPNGWWSKHKNSSLLFSDGRIMAKRKASSKQQRKVQLREETRAMQLKREERERKEKEEMERRPEPPIGAAESLREANERIEEADAKFQSAVDSTREIKKMKRESAEWDPRIGYGKFREVSEQVKEMNGLRVRTYETRLERAVFLIELAKGLGNASNSSGSSNSSSSSSSSSSRSSTTGGGDDEDSDYVGGINDDAVVANDVGAVGKTLDAFDWVYGKEFVDESNARTVEFMLRASQKKSQNDGLKPEISFEILNVAVAAEALGCINNKDNVIQKHVKRVQKGIDGGLISPNDDAANALLEKIDAFLQEQERQKQ